MMWTPYHNASVIDSNVPNQSGTAIASAMIARLAAHMMSSDKINAQTPTNIIKFGIHTLKSIEDSACRRVPNGPKVVLVWNIGQDLLMISLKSQ